MPTTNGHAFSVGSHRCLNCGIHRSEVVAPTEPCPELAGS